MSTSTAPVISALYAGALSKSKFSPGKRESNEEKCCGENPRWPGFLPSWSVIELVCGRVNVVDRGGFLSEIDVTPHYSCPSPYRTVIRVPSTVIRLLSRSYYCQIPFNYSYLVFDEFIRVLQVHVFFLHRTVDRRQCETPKSVAP